MIRTFLILTILSFAIISSKKNYTCSCAVVSIKTAYVEEGTYYPQSTEENTTNYSLNETEKKAKSTCSSYQTNDGVTYNVGESSQYKITTTSTCEIH